MGQAIFEEAFQITSRVDYELIQVVALDPMVIVAKAEPGFLVHSCAAFLSGMTELPSAVTFRWPTILFL